MKLLHVSLVLVVAAGALLVGGSHLAEAPPAVPRQEATQPDTFFDKVSFYRGLKEVQARPPALQPGRLAGGVVPHHNLAGAMLSTFFIQLEAAPPKSVIVIGPNHEHRGQRVITGRRGWATPFGTVAADQEMVDALVKAGLATLDDAALEQEHTVGALMPYLKYHAPATRVVPIILHRDISLAEMEKLAQVLAPLLAEGSLLVASVDFSHYLTRAEAEAKDHITWAAIERFDLAGLKRMGPDHLDSPAALGILMLTMRQLGAGGPAVEGHTNAGVLLGSDQIDTTSYFVLTYRVK
ncbi:MAG TPA: AmmeMemoRadiSam system protein B [Symbiobacteriaceae bacterium]|nr:AmmeMemoRadiSam system protein B [Symbiobacteriaceae bacterium]